ncbi:MAG: type I DNA topoisomerase [Duncaniella sp.]|nr:type I DNA topoisomerase [Muribaculum sp.]MCM1256135.1 type I DNA topoisomerase [Duncaniella sp.]
MIKNLVIVESPAKAKTIEKFLGKDYKVMSSYGHIRDLRKKDISINVDSDFQPIYEIPADKKTLVAELKKAANEADTVWLASDEDREGEAIAWHLYEVLGLKPENTRRIVFHEITKNAILNAIENPREIDLHLVDAQQARRVLDRLVGFELSPVLWKKIKPALSAGRVQSVAVRLIVDRENEINNFKSEEYYRVTALFTVPGGAQVQAELSRRLPDEKAAREFLDDCAKAVFTVSDINVKPIKKSPAPPFTTSTLQQEASRKLGFTVAQTMMIAQKLYEAGHITYMRTDSLNLSSLAISTISNLIKTELGEEYLKVRKYHTNSKGAQEAHEAIRPTYIDHETIDGTAQEKRLYRLIRLRTMASQMADAELEKTTIDISPSTRSEHFTATGEVLKFDGFLKVYLEGNDDESESSSIDTILPPMKVGQTLKADSVTATERFTLAPPRYTEASLVKKMEDLGIGRPSTYAPTISTIQHREYIVKGEKPGVKRTYNQLILDSKDKISQKTKSENVGAEKGKLIPTDTGIIVNEFLTEHFPDILDYDFTASMEEKFDQIAEGESNWNQEIGQFYNLFHPEVEKANDMHTEHKVGERVLGTDPQTGEPVSVKIGRFGPIVQIGSADSENKPRFASLRKDQSVFDITLEEALKLFDLPRQLGEYEGKVVVSAIGRFGPYIRHDGKFVSIPKTLSPTSITIDEAIDLINTKREADSNKTVKTFDEAPDIKILNGRYGVYIARGKENFKIPKSVTTPADLTLEEVNEIIANQEKTPKKTVRRASRTKKA